MPHAYAIELVQLLFAMIGATLNIWTLTEASTSKKFQLVSGRGTKASAMYAASSVRQEQVRLAVQVILVLLGLIAVLTPPPFVQYEVLATLPMELRRNLAATRSGLTLISILLAWKSWQDLTDRRALLLLAAQLSVAEPDRRKRQIPIQFPERREDGPGEPG